MQNDRKLAGEMAKCDGWGLEEAVDSTVQDWIERGEGGTDHYVTQFLTGHGSFGTYLRRIGKVQVETCKRNKRAGSFVGLCEMGEGKEGNWYATARGSHGR